MVERLQADRSAEIRQRALKVSGDPAGVGAPRVKPAGVRDHLDGPAQMPHSLRESAGGVAGGAAVEGVRPGQPLIFLGQAGNEAVVFGGEMGKMRLSRLAPVIRADGLRAIENEIQDAANV